MSQTRENILEALKDGLIEAGIAKTVVRRKFTDTQLQNLGTPAIAIVDEGDITNALIALYQVSEMTVRLNCHVTQDDNENKYFNELLENIRAYISSASLDDDVQYIREMSVGTPETGNEKAIFNVELKIRYRFLRSAP